MLWKQTKCANFGSVIFAFLQNMRFVKCQMHFLTSTYNAYLLNTQFVKCHLMNRKFWQCRFCVFTKYTVFEMSNAFSDINLQRILAKYAICDASVFVFAKCANFDNDIFAHLIYREFWQCLFCDFTKYAFSQGQICTFN